MRGLCSAQDWLEPMAGGLSLIGLVIVSALAWCGCAMLRGGRAEMEKLGLIGYGKDLRAHVRSAEDVQ